MLLEPHKSYIQKNPYLGRKVIHVDRLRESVWDWNLCDLTAIHLEDFPSIERKHGLASTVYDNQGLEEIPDEVFLKLQSLARLYEAMAKAAGQEYLQPQANETLACCLKVLSDASIIDETTYTHAQLLKYASDYEQYATAQMQRVTDVIDVHK